MSQFNFEDSISIGIQRADSAEANKSEIAQIFKDFSESFLRASHNKIHSELKLKQRRVGRVRNPLFAAAAFLDNDYETYTALILSNGAQEYVIAEIIESEDGYPLRIKIKGDTSAYSDKDSLVDGLSRLVTRTEVGKYYKLLLIDE
jgi:hypothetical protein